MNLRSLQKIAVAIAIICVCNLPLIAQQKNTTKTSGNPIFPGWYADPEALIFGQNYWVYPTWSAPYGEQVFFDAFSSSDLITWTKHPRILDTSSVKWAKRA